MNKQAFKEAVWLVVQAVVFLLVFWAFIEIEALVNPL